MSKYHNGLFEREISKGHGMGKRKTHMTPLLTHITNIVGRGFMCTRKKKFRN
jgi:hypothetical protein